MTLETAYREAGPRIVGYLVATGTDESAARDLLHDAVLRVARQLQERADFAAVGEGRAPARPSESEDNIPALLFTTARNLRANLVRDNSRVALVESVPENSAMVDSRKAMTPSDADYVRRRISDAMAALPAALREAYTLYQIAELSVREVASMTGASENLVKVRLHRAKKALRKALSDLDARRETRDVT